MLESVPPLHLACTTATMFDSFPAEGDLDFSKNYGMESTHFNRLNKYLTGHNVGSRTMPLNFPVFQTVSPKSNSTVARSICVWLSEFSSLVTFWMIFTLILKEIFRFHQKWTDIWDFLIYHSLWMIKWRFRNLWRISNFKCLLHRFMPVENIWSMPDLSLDLQVIGSLDKKLNISWMLSL